MSSDYANKLKAFEARPPEGAWNRIANALEGSSVAPAADRLFFYEATPPAGIWQKIEASLPQEPAKVVSIFHRYRRPLRYASATAALVVIGLLASLLLSKRTESESLAKGNPVEQAGKSAPAPQLEPNRTTTVTASAINVQRIPEEETGKMAYRSAATGSGDRLSYLNTTDVTRGLRRAVRSSMLFRRLFSVPDEPRALPPTDGADRYMVFSDGNGNIARLPKKMYDAVRCKEDDLACQQRIRLLQQKLSSSAFTTDFTGVMQILGNLQENK